MKGSVVGGFFGGVGGMVFGLGCEDCAVGAGGVRVGVKMVVRNAVVLLVVVGGLKGVQAGNEVSGWRWSHSCYLVGSAGFVIWHWWWRFVEEERARDVHHAYWLHKSGVALDVQSSQCANQSVRPEKALDNGLGGMSL